MAWRTGVLLCAVLCVSSPAIAAGAETPASERVVIVGAGAAHGFGMAMDGVEGQARAGWSHDKILSLFYRGTTTGRYGGTIRVGLVDAYSTRLTLPGGGTISPIGGSLSPDVPGKLPAGARIVVRKAGKGVVVRVGGVPLETPEPAAEGGVHHAEEPGVIPTAAPPTPPPAPQITPSPTPPPKPTTPPTPKTVATPAPPPLRGIRVTPAGNPAVTGVDATGRRYRGTIEVTRTVSGAMRAINHVDLEAYVWGIAEEKGQAWPSEGLKTLAVAARSLAASAMSWHSNNHAEGYDICPTSNCQVYIGIDGEEPALTSAAQATAGQIRTYNGRPILAMYHGNGGGRTESYSRVSELDIDVYPYLKSVRYPFADPSRWKVETTMDEIAAKLSAAGIAVPGPLERIKVLERGDSPRVIRMRVAGGLDDFSDLRGTTFANALKLRSTWFEIVSGRKAVVLSLRGGPAEFTDAALDPSSPGKQERRSWPIAATATVVTAVAVGAAATLRRTSMLASLQTAAMPLTSRALDVLSDVRDRLRLVLARLRRRG